MPRKGLIPPDTRHLAPQSPTCTRQWTRSSAGNPEYFAWLSDQGMLPIEEVKRQLRIFGEQILQIELAKGKTTTRFAHANEDRRPPNIGSP